MNKNRKRITTTCSIQQESKKIDTTEKVSEKRSKKNDAENESHQHSYEIRVSGHSTPIHKRDHVLDVDDSPEVDYRYSPISLPCTQDGGNEIAWDWQFSVNKNCNENIKAHSNIETPKRARHLQKKRNSNSPLLQQTKQVKRENIEDIGKFTAELKALTERMKSMQKNSEIDTSVKKENIEPEYGTVLVINLDDEKSDDLMLKVNAVKDEPKLDPIKIERNIKKESNYDDLFDDSIEDSMVKCSQEVENKLNLGETKANNVEELSVVFEEKEESSTFEKEIQCLTTTSNNSPESSRNSNTSKSSLSFNTSGRLKTYSNNSSRTNSTSNASISSSTGARPRKSLFNSSWVNAQDGKHMLQEKDMSVFPNDSFDDCLATCIDDDKVLSKLSEYDFSVSNTGRDSGRLKKSSKQASSNTVNNNKRILNSIVPKSEHSSNNVKSNGYNGSKLIIHNELVDEINALDYKETVQQSFAGTNTLENRKFFKTKSLSDQYLHQNKNSNADGKTTKTARTTSSVSTTFPIVQSQNPYGSNTHSLINGVGNARTLNRLEANEGGNGIVKHKSASSLCSIKEVKESQSVQCTPAEIERKRLEAKMRLEAKRKLQQNTGIANTPSEVPMKKSVKR